MARYLKVGDYVYIKSTYAGLYLGGMYEHHGRGYVGASATKDHTKLWQILDSNGAATSAQVSTSSAKKPGAHLYTLANASGSRFGHFLHYGFSGFSSDWVEYHSNPKLNGVSSVGFVPQSSGAEDSPIAINEQGQSAPFKIGSGGGILFKHQQVQLRPGGAGGKQQSVPKWDKGEYFVFEYACASNTDCPSGTVCTAGSCVAAPACTSNTDCPSGTICQSGHCIRSTCSNDKDCPAGMICQGGSCVSTTPAPPSFWDKNKYYIIGTVIALIVLIAIVAFLGSKRPAKPKK